MLLRLCGDPALLNDDGQRVALGRKALALLAYLTLEPGPHARARLAALLWPESDEMRAAMSLRQAVARLRETLGARLESDRQHIGLVSFVLDNDTVAWRCDVTEFQAKIDCDALAATMTDVRAFLEPPPIDDAPDFAHWLDRTRAGLVRRAEVGLRRAARDAAARREWKRAGEIAERWVVMDALSEEAASSAIEAAFMRRDAARGRALYSAFQSAQQAADLIRARHHAAPGANVDALVRRLEDVITATPVHGTGTVHAAMPAVALSTALYERDAVWAMIASEWNRVTNAARTSVVLAQGGYGSGRTRLLADAASWIASRGASVLTAPSRGARGALPYMTLAALLHGAVDAPALGGVDEHHLAVLGELQPEIATRFPGVRSAVKSVATETRFPQRVYSALMQVVEALCEDAPLVIALDDVVWCDRESATVLQLLLQSLLARAEPIPVLWLVSAPENEATENESSLVNDIMQCAVNVALSALSASAIAGMLRELSEQNDGWDALSSRVLDVSHGVPAAVLAVLQQVRTDVGEDWARFREAGVRVPPIHLRLRSRADGLSDLAREMLLGLALVMEDGHPLSFDAWHERAPVSLDTLSHLHGISRLRAARLGTTLAEAGLAVELPDGLRCGSPLVAEYMYGSSSPLVASELRRRLRKLRSER